MQGLVCLGSGGVGVTSAIEGLMLWELGLERDRPKVYVHVTPPWKD